MIKNVKSMWVTTKVRGNTQACSFTGSPESSLPSSNYLVLNVVYRNAAQPCSNGVYLHSPHIGCKALFLDLATTRVIHKIV